MNSIGQKLKLLRNAKKYSTKTVIQKLHLAGFEISDKTLYGYENGANMPNADIFIELCKIYECNNILEVFSEMKIDYSIPDDSTMSVAKKYSALDDYGKDLVNTVIEKESERKKAQEKENKAATLEDEDSEYIELVARGGKYKVKKADAIEWAKQLDLDDYEEDHDLC
jgi:transcriptional regulator with XRE-family HTH domain